MNDEERILYENALQMIGRLQNRPLLYDLEPGIFHDGPKAKQIIEVYGECGSGKTFLMKDLAKKCILSKSYFDLSLPGLEAGVVYLNNDLHLNVRTFGNFFMGYLEKIVPNTFKDRQKAIKEIAECSLKRLTIFNIHCSDTMFITFHLLKTFLISNKDVSLIIIDSICSNYWQDRMTDGIYKMDSYTTNVLSRLNKCIESFKVTVMFTRPSYFQSKACGITEVSPELNMFKVNISIQLVKAIREDGHYYYANVRSSDEVLLKFFSITSEGIIWAN